MVKQKELGKDHYFISGDWEQYRKEKYAPVAIQSFTGSYTGNDTEIIYYTEYRSGLTYYTHPSYISSVNWINLDLEISNFHLTSVKNNYTPSMVISFKGGVPNSDERKQVKKDLQKSYAGSENASSVFVTFSETADTAPEFIPIQTNSSDDMFVNLEEQIQQNIIVGHNASPIVAGVAVAGKLGSSSEIEEAEEVFFNTVIKPRQTSLEAPFNMILKVNGSTEEVELSSLRSIVKEEEIVNVDIDTKDLLSSIITIAEKIQSGVITLNAGVSMLNNIYGIEKDKATEMLEQNIKIEE